MFVSSAAYNEEKKKKKKKKAPAKKSCGQTKWEKRAACRCCPGWAGLGWAGLWVSRPSPADDDGSALLPTPPPPPPTSNLGSLGHSRPAQGHSTAGVNGVLSVITSESRRTSYCVYFSGDRQDNASFQIPSTDSQHASSFSFLPALSRSGIRCLVTALWISTKKKKRKKKNPNACRANSTPHGSI